MKYLIGLLLILVACTVQTPDIAVNTSMEKACTEEAKVCEDGTYVSRNSENNCEFDPCPIAVKKQCPLDTKSCGGGVVVSRNIKKNCEFDACPFQIDQNFAASYADGKVSYVAKVTKKTPCHGLNITQKVVTTNVVQVRIDLETISPTPNTFCAQVETVEVIKGFVLSETKPNGLSIFLEGIQLYSTKEFE